MKKILFQFLGGIHLVKKADPIHLVMLDETHATAGQTSGVNHPVFHEMMSEFRLETRTVMIKTSPYWIIYVMVYGCFQK